MLAQLLCESLAHLLQEWLELLLQELLEQELCLGAQLLQLRWQRLGAHLLAQGDLWAQELPHFGLAHDEQPEPARAGVGMKNGTLSTASNTLATTVRLALRARFKNIAVSSDTR